MMIRSSTSSRLKIFSSFSRSRLVEEVIGDGRMQNWEDPLFRNNSLWSLEVSLATDIEGWSLCRTPFFPRKILKSMSSYDAINNRSRRGPSVCLKITLSGSLKCLVFKCYARSCLCSPRSRTKRLCAIALSGKGFRLMRPAIDQALGTFSDTQETSRVGSSSHCRRKGGWIEKHIT